MGYQFHYFSSTVFYLNLNKKLKRQLTKVNLRLYYTSNLHKKSHCELCINNKGQNNMILYYFQVQYNNQYIHSKYNNQIRLLINMKLLLQYQDESRQKIKRLYLQNCTYTDDIIKIVSQCMNLKQTEFYLTLYIDQVSVRIIKSWEVSHYRINEGDMIYLNYLNSRKSSHGIIMEDFLSIHIQNVNKQCDNECFQSLLKNFLEFTIQGNLDKVKWLINTPSRECIKSKNSRQIRLQFLLNQLGIQGWGALHYAIHYQYKSIFQFLLKNDSNPNIISSDGWTPLLLAVEVKNFDITKKLLEKKNIDVNLVTSRGTALHLAAKKGLFQIMYLLLQHNANQQIKDNNGITVIQLCHNQKCKQLLLNRNKNIPAKNKILEEIPPLVSGYLYQIRKILHFLKCVYLVLDPNDGTLKIFKNEELFPKNPELCIKLQDIEQVKLVEDQQRKYYMKKGLIYLKISFKWKNSIIFCSKYQNIIIKWMNSIKKSKQFLLIQNIDQYEQAAYTLYLNNNTNKIVVIRKQNRSVLSGSEISQQQEPINFTSFDFINILGTGAFAKVFLARLKKTSELYAIKVLNKQSLIKLNQLKYAQTQVNILKTIIHPFIVKLKFSFQTTDYLYMVLQYCSGGDLSEYITKKGRMNQKQARIIIAQVILAIEYLHSHNIIYRDMKPENILIGSDGYIKLADFGLSKQNIRDQYANTFCGSPVYTSPELLETGLFCRESDIYGIGCILYQLLDGFPAFYNDNIAKLYESIKAGAYTIPKNLNSITKDLIAGMLQTNPSKRLTIKQIKNHQFFKNFDWQKLIQKKYLSAKYIQQKKQIQEPQMTNIGTESQLFFDRFQTDSNYYRRKVLNFTYLN